jgi:hypothetical protein
MMKKQRQEIKEDTRSGGMNGNQQTNKKKDSSTEDKEKVLVKDFYLFDKSVLLIYSFTSKQRNQHKSHVVRKVK